MKTIVLGLLFAALALADVNWYYQIGQPPASLPQGPAIAGVMVFVKKPAASGSVCVQYTLVSDSTTRSACASFTQGDDEYPYIGVRLNLAADSSDFHVTAITVTAGETTKTVVSPVPGPEY